MEKKQKGEKRRRGDRRDAYLIRELDSMHKFMPFLLPNRCDNEACMSELVELSAINEYVKKLNADNPEFRYTLFHVICAAIVKTIALRPKLNWFISGYRYYERKEISISFVVKKTFEDEAREALAILKIDRDGENPIKQIHDKTEKFVTAVRKHDKQDSTTDIMDILVKLPRWLLKLVTGIINKLDNRGKLPKSMTESDPYCSSVFVSNLGSIKMHASYHHLTNYGNNSLFAIIDEKHLHPFFDENGNCEMREALRLGLTVDERIADGTYFAKSVRLMKKLLENPELLEQPINTPVEL